MRIPGERKFGHKDYLLGLIRLISVLFAQFSSVPRFIDILDVTKYGF